MPGKRPHASEGHLALPARPADGVAPEGAGRTVEVAGDELAAHDIRAGDRVLLARRAAIEHGDVVALRDVQAGITLWKAYPGSEHVRLENAGGSRDVPGDAAFEGVVIAVVRRFRS